MLKVSWNLLVSTCWIRHASNVSQKKPVQCNAVLYVYSIHSLRAVGRGRYGRTGCQLHCHPGLTLFLCSFMSVFIVTSKLPHVLKILDPYDILEQLRQNTSVISDFQQWWPLFICLLIVCEKFDTDQEPPAWFIETVAQLQDTTPAKCAGSTVECLHQEISGFMLPEISLLVRTLTRSITIKSQSTSCTCV